MSLYDAIIVQNLTQRSIDVSYNLLQGLFVTAIPAQSIVIITDVRLENLTDSVRSVLIPKRYIKVTPYRSTTRIPKPANWVESGLESRCLAIASLTSNIHTRTDYSFTKKITEIAALGGTIVYTPASTAYTIVGTAHGAHALTSHILAQYKITKSLSGTHALSGTLDYTPAVAGTMWDVAYPNNGGGFIYSNGDLTVSMTGNQFAARSTTTKTTGKWYYEITMNSFVNNGEILAGMIPDAADGSIRIYECGNNDFFDTPVSGNGLFAFHYNGTLSATSIGTPGGLTTGQVIGFAIDLDTPLVQIIINGVTYSNPYAPVTGIAYRIGLAMQIGNSGVMTLNTQGSFFNTPPAGYLAWDTALTGIGHDAIGSTLQVY